MRRTMLLLFLIIPVVLGCEEEALNLKIRYDHIRGLKKNDRVIFEQNQIGAVKNVTYSDKADYIVHVVIIKNFVKAATEYSRFFIVEDPLNKENMAVEMVHTLEGGKPLKNNSVIEGSTKASAFLNQFLDEFAQGFGKLQTEIDQLLKDLGGIPASEEFKKLEDELKRLKKEMTESGDELKKKIRDELLPRLKQEMDALKERLRELGREDELKPLETEMEAIKKL